VVACPTPVRAAENCLEPRDREGGMREKLVWIIVEKLARVNLTSAGGFM